MRAGVANALEAEVVASLAEEFLRRYDRDPKNLGAISPGIESITRMYRLRDVYRAEGMSPLPWVVGQTEGVFLIWLTASLVENSTVDHVVVADCAKRHVIDCAVKYKLKLCEEVFNKLTGDDAGDAEVKGMKFLSRQDDGRGGPGKVRRTHRRRDKKRKQRRLNE